MSLIRLTKIVFSIILLAVVVGGTGCYLYWQNYLEKQLSVPESDMIYEVLPGTSFSSLAVDLASRGIIDDPWMFKLYGRISGKSHQIKAGEFRFQPKLTVPELVETLSSGQVVRYQVTFPEGWRVSEYLEELSRHQKLEQHLKGVDYTAISHAVGLEGQHPEGWFFPSTYHYVKGDSDVAVLKRALSKMQQVLEQEWQAAQPVELPVESPYEVLILASIVEKETGVPEEREQIAGVFVRRLLKGMRLQTDPTVIYGMGERYSGNITRADLKRATPYNTYVIKGLPPTPIANPGLGAIHAVLNPDDSKTIFFVARGDGTHVFSKTHREHINAVRKYQVNSRRRNYRSSPSQ